MRRTFQNAISAKLRSDMAIGPDWQGQHHRAIVYPRGSEVPIVEMLKGWFEYADHHFSQFESLIGDDGFLGQHWEAIGDALRALLNGDCGRLDCGTVDGFILNTMRDNGIDTENK
jgi:hypothetical protein